MVKLGEEEVQKLRAMEESVRAKKIRVADLARQRLLAEQEQIKLLHEIEVETNGFFEEVADLMVVHGLDPNGDSKWSLSSDCSTLVPSAQAN